MSTLTELKTDALAARQVHYIDLENFIREHTKFKEFNLLADLNWKQTGPGCMLLRVDVRRLENSQLFAAQMEVAWLTGDLKEPRFEYNAVSVILDRMAKVGLIEEGKYVVNMDVTDHRSHCEVADV